MRFACHPSKSRCPNYVRLPGWHTTQTSRCQSHDVLTPTPLVMGRDDRKEGPPTAHIVAGPLIATSRVSASLPPPPPSRYGRPRQRAPSCLFWPRSLGSIVTFGWLRQLEFFRYLAVCTLSALADFVLRRLLSLAYHHPACGYQPLQPLSHSQIPAILVQIQSSSGK